MKLFHHYKNKPYKFVGLATHSETLESMVIYECRYDNPTAKIWVRPQKMFEESVNLSGRQTPRFKKIELHLKQTTQITEKEISSIATISEKAFGHWNKDYFYSTFKNHSKFFLILAFIEDVAVGFKLGYERNDRQFYSWLGGVLPEFHGVGIAGDLLQVQHDWCRAQGYKTIQTKTLNKFKQMLLLNIKSGFDIIGTESHLGKDTEIILQKTL